MPGLLLVGANGQVGHEIAVRSALASVACTSLTRAELDVTRRDDVLRTLENHSPDVVVNASAYTAVDKAETEPDLAYAVNRDGAAHLAEACGRHNIPLVHISTDYVFDGAKKAPYVEDDPVAPLGAYGASKLAGERAVRDRCARHLILRTSWVYGLHGHNFVKTMLRLGREREMIRVVDDQFGTPTYSGDLADTIVEIATRVMEDRVAGPGWGTFHCAGQGAVSWCGFARRIFAQSEFALGRKVEVQAITSAEFPTPARRPANSVLDCSRLLDVHGLKLRPWSEALDEMIDNLTCPRP
jgi:dTDP-4-dehydrorhamnose reductase